MHTHTHRFIQPSPYGYFRCATVACTELRHTASCIDEDGKLECCCGLELRQELAAAAALADAEDRYAR